MGLIGGSMALALREKGIASAVIGVDANPLHRQQALELGLADEMRELDAAVAEAGLVVLAVPVQVCASANACVNRNRFVATHPMWGTEHSGPAAAVANAFVNKAAVICNKEQSDPDAVALTERIYTALGMHLLYMEAAAHDLHAAYVSHISHITSFALANTVLEKEKEEDAIFELASGGFESTVRLAKSNPAMWVPIFQQNKENVLDVLNEHISQLRKIKSCLEKENFDYLRQLIEHANEIKRILK
jgi:prephenate dehydrogenase